MGYVEKPEPAKKVFQRTETVPIDIDFQDLKYIIRGGECKEILKSISGKFCSGELTAILGPTGAGKTILLKVLAGYLSDGVEGSININGEPREMKLFHKLSAYIMQEDLLQPQLTLNESMMIAARFKLGNISSEEKRVIIARVLNLLGLENCVENRTENLSGGERRRLSIALEMVSNPHVIFLDEPTSGLDTVAIRQCIDVLKKLANQGTTVICTVHQPSASTFKLFDQVYFVANGTCVYNGSTTNIVPFLSSVELECPVTHSPAEFIIETVQINEEYVPALAAATENGKVNNRNLEESYCLNKSLPRDLPYTDTLNKNRHTTTNEQDFNFPTSSWMQFCVLFGRMMLQLGRNRVALCIQLFHFGFVGLFMGILFFGIGNDAEMAVSVLKYCLFVNFYFVYTYLLPLILLFPAELKLLKREYFNRWYGLKPYVFALTLRSVPIMMTLSTSFLLISYTMSSQPLELYRFIRFASACLLNALICESVAQMIGSLCNMATGAILAPTVSAPGVCLCFYGLGYASTMGPFMKFLMYANYMRCSFVAICLALFENRAPYECNEIYCRYKYPENFLREIGMADESYGLHMLILVVNFLVFRLIAFVALRCRLSSRFSQKVVDIKTRTVQFWKKSGKSSKS